MDESLKFFIDDKNFSDIISESDNITDEEEMEILKDKIRNEREELFYL